MKPKILINVSGGLVQSIVTNTEDIDIVIVDYDSEEWAKDGSEVIPDSTSVQMHYRPDVVCDPIWKIGFW